MSALSLTAASSPFDCVPHRPVRWARAFKALARLRHGEFDSAIAREFGAALEGDEGERAFRAFSREPNAHTLLSERPDLAAALDDHEALALLPEASLGRAYLALAADDQIRVQELVRGSRGLPADLQYCPDPLRAWYRERSTALHDLHHVLTGYGRDGAGEIALVAFSLALGPKRVWRVSLLFALIGAPKRRLGRVLAYLYRAWKRGKKARIPAAVRWEEQLSRPLAEVRALLSIEPALQAHPQGIWRGDLDALGRTPGLARIDH